MVTLILSSSFTLWSLLVSNGDVSRRLPLRALNAISQLVPPELHTHAAGSVEATRTCWIRRTGSLTCLSPGVGRSRYQPRFVLQSSGLLLVTRLPPDSDNTVCATKSLRAMRVGVCSSLSNRP